MTEHKRRIDVILNEEFLADSQTVDLDELHTRREMVLDVESELSYYRRLLHGRLDLLEFEMERRAGREHRSLIEALPEILGAGESGGGGQHRASLDIPDIPDVGRRPIDHVLDDAFTTRLSSLDESELGDLHAQIGTIESEISIRRRAVQEVDDALRAEVTSRYRSIAESLQAE